MKCTCLCDGACPDDSWPASPNRGECPREAAYHWFYDIPRTSLREQQMCVHETLCVECAAWRREQTGRWKPERSFLRSL